MILHETEIKPHIFKNTKMHLHTEKSPSDHLEYPEKKQSPGLLSRTHRSKKNKTRIKSNPSWMCLNERTDTRVSPDPDDWYLLVLTRYLYLNLYDQLSVQLKIRQRREHVPVSEKQTNTFSCCDERSQKKKNVKRSRWWKHDHLWPVNQTEQRWLQLVTPTWSPDTSHTGTGTRRRRRLGYFLFLLKRKDVKKNLTELINGLIL